MSRHCRQIIGRIAPVFLAATGLFLFAGCRRQEVSVYRVPKEEEREEMPAGHPERRPVARPELAWKLPAGWQESAPGRLSLASFTLGQKGHEADVSITPLPSLAGKEAMVINMWREQMGLEPRADDAVAKDLAPIEVAGEKGSLFEIAGKTKDGEPVSIVTAMVHRPDGTWFYKMSGDAATVAQEKPAFLEFLKSIQIKAVASQTAAAGDAHDHPHGMKWAVPAGWTEVAHGEMQSAKFQVPSRGDARGEVSVSVFPSDTGGVLANVNRWRNQLGLKPIAEGELKSVVSPLDPANSRAVLVDMTNGARQLVGAIVPRAGGVWFYKMMGEAAAVGPEKAAFVSFARSEP